MVEALTELPKGETDTWMAKKASINGREHEARMRWDSYVAMGGKDTSKRNSRSRFLGDFRGISSGGVRHGAWVDAMSRKQQQGRSSNAAD